MQTKVFTFDSEGIAVTWDAKRCIHAEACVHGLPRVFDPERRPWIEPEHAGADAVAATVTQCPTGALHFERRDGGPAEPVPERNAVAVEADGPLYVHGDVTVVDAEGEVLLRDTRVALCRCGLSANKPLCDNSHLGAFADAGALGTSGAITSEAAASGPPLRVRVLRNGPLVVEGPVTITAADGRTGSGAKVSLCRCGRSNNKPFCDGTHKAAGFTAD